MKTRLHRWAGAGFRSRFALGLCAAMTALETVTWSWAADPAAPLAEKSGAATPADPFPGISETAGVPLVPLAIRTELRELSTDRPDQTESPYTVPAGHFQVEADVVRLTLDRKGDGAAEIRSREWSTSVNLKAGLTARTDLQMVFDPLIHRRVEDVATGASESTSGSGDFVTRLKVNLWGNDGGSTALALMPYVKWPLSASALRNGEWEGGLIAVLGVELPAGWGAAVMTEVDAVSEDGGGHDLAFVNSVTFGRALVGALDGYAEFYSAVGTEPGAGWVGQIGAGLTYGWTRNLQLDAGCNFGVTTAAPDFEPFLGISYRY